MAIPNLVNTEDFEFSYHTESSLFEDIYGVKRKTIIHDNFH